MDEYIAPTMQLRTLLPYVVRREYTGRRAYADAKRNGNRARPLATLLLTATKDQRLDLICKSREV